MKIVIEVSDDEYKQIMERHVNMCSSSDMFIRQGTVLPKGHGRLIDAGELQPKLHGTKSIIAGLEAPTIVEADKDETDD